MKHMITAAVMLACLLLCSCEGRTENSTGSDSITAVTTTVIAYVSGATGTESAADSGKETTAKKITATTAQSVTTGTSAVTDEADIAISEVSETVALENPPEHENSATHSDIEQPRQTTTTTTANVSAPDSDSDSENILPDDGLDWSPLVPVD